MVFIVDRILKENFGFDMDEIWWLFVINWSQTWSVISKRRGRIILRISSVIDDE